MNLGIEGRTALVCASSQGLGLACAQALAQEGVHVVINGRDAAKLDKTAAALRETARGDVTAVAADVTTADGQARLLAVCPSPDILVNNNAGPSPGNFADIELARAKLNRSPRDGSAMPRNSVRPVRSFVAIWRASCRARTSISTADRIPS